MEYNNVIYTLWLSRVKGIGSKTGKKLLEGYKSPQRIYEMARDGSREHPPGFFAGVKMEGIWGELVRAVNEIPLEQIFHDVKLWEEQGIHLICMADEVYPERLAKIPDPPMLLYYKGRLPDAHIPSVAIVGARECSTYGEYVANQLGQALGLSGIQVISGMARGIDGISQRAAVENGGASFGVLGSGVDVCYPKSNQALYEKLCENGGVLSSYPPGTMPTSANFPPRNRIVSGLSDALVVVEARAKSGTLITVDMALEQGKDVFVVPGRITDRLSDGCNRLLSLGATPFLTPNDFIRQLKEICGAWGQIRVAKESECKEMKGNQKDGRKEENKERKEKRDVLNIHGMDSRTDCIRSVLERTPLSTGEILKRLQKKENMEYADLTVELLKMCTFGLAKQVSPGQFISVE